MCIQHSKLQRIRLLLRSLAHAHCDDNILNEEVRKVCACLSLCIIAYVQPCIRTAQRWYDRVREAFLRFTCGRAPCPWPCRVLSEAKQSGIYFMEKLSFKSRQRNAALALIRCFVPTVDLRSTLDEQRKLSPSIEPTFSLCRSLKVDAPQVKTQHAHMLKILRWARYSTQRGDANHDAAATAVSSTRT